MSFHKDMRDCVRKALNDAASKDHLEQANAVLLALWNGGFIGQAGMRSDNHAVAVSSWAFADGIGYAITVMNQASRPRAEWEERLLAQKEEMFRNNEEKVLEFWGREQWPRLYPAKIDEAQP